MAMTLPAVGWIDGSVPPISAANLGKYDSYFTDIAKAAGTRTLGTLDADTLGGYSYTQVVNNALPGSNTATPLTISGQTLAAQSGNYYVNQATNPFIINLPQASTCVGAKIRISNFSVVSTGLIKIIPYTADIIGDQGSDNPIYLQNVDASGALVPQTVEIVAFSGYWNVNGQYHPTQGVDTNGSQYILGKLHYIPTSSTISRVITIPQIALSTWTSSQQCSGLYGVPIGARGVLVTIRTQAVAAASSSARVTNLFSNDNSVTPTSTYSAPLVGSSSPSASAGAVINNSAYQQIIIPLNSSGSFYMYCLDLVSITVASSSVMVAINGYYMGD